MSAQDETIKLTLQVAGADAMATLEKSTENYRALLEQLIGDWQRGEVTTEEFLATQKKHAGELERQTTLLHGLRDSWDVMIAAQEREAAAAADAAAAEARQVSILDQLGVSLNREGAAIADAAAAEARRITTLDQLGISLGKTTAAQDKLAGAAKAGAKGTMDIGNAALQASRGIEDMQYGFAGVVNNIPQLVMAFGGGMGVTAAISLAAIAVNQLINHWTDLTTMFEDKVPFPKAGKDIAAMKDELEKAKKSMDELGKHTELTLDQLAKYNGLRAEAARLEKEITDEQKKQKELADWKKAAVETRNPQIVAADKARKEALTNAIGGRQDQVVTALAKERQEKELAQAEFDYENATTMANAVPAQKEGEPLAVFQARQSQQQRKWLARMKEAKRRIATLQQQGWQGQVEGAQVTVGQALSTGDEAATKEIEHVAAERPELMPDMMPQDLHQIANVERDAAATMPEAKEAKKKAEARAKKEAKEADDAWDAADKQYFANEKQAARDKLQALAKGDNLVDRFAKMLKEIQQQKGLMIDGVFHAAATPEEQFALLRAQAERYFREQMQEAGIDSVAAREEVHAAAAQTAAAADAKIDRKRADARTAREEERKKELAARKKREDESMESGGYTAAAGSALAQGRAQGGIVDAAGRFHAMTETEIQTYIVQQIMAELRRRNPGMTEGQAWGLAQRTLTKASAEIDEQMIAMNASGLPPAQRLEQIFIWYQNQLVNMQAHAQHMQWAAMGVHVNTEPDHPAGGHGGGHGGGHRGGHGHGGGRGFQSVAPRPASELGAAPAAAPAPAAPAPMPAPAESVAPAPVPRGGRRRRRRGPVGDLPSTVFRTPYVREQALYEHENRQREARIQAGMRGDPTNRAEAAALNQRNRDQINRDNPPMTRAQGQALDRANRADINKEQARATAQIVANQQRQAQLTAQMAAHYAALRAENRRVEKMLDTTQTTMMNMGR